MFMSRERLMWAIGVEGDKYRPHVENAECADENCIPITADEVQPTFNRVVLDPNTSYSIDGRSLYTLLYVTTVCLSDPQTTYHGMSRKEIESAAIIIKQVLERTGYAVPVAVSVT